jgi:tRNA 2-thiocytidine biosynthesis protein TtcA
LHRRRRMAREQYQIIAAHVRTDMHCGRSVPIDWLQGWCAERNIPLAIDTLAIAEEVATTTLSGCFRCAWNRRKALFRLADQWGCNKLAFGHHADDIAETTLMNLFYNAAIRPMEPKMNLFDGRLVAIRPLAYVEERDIVPFVQASGFPVQGEPCPEGASSRRAVVKRILRELEQDNHAVKRHIYWAVERYQQALQQASGASDDEREDGAAGADTPQAAM